MVSKGIRVYVWVAVDGYHVNFTVPKNAIRQGDILHTWSTHLLEVEAKNVTGPFNLAGAFTFSVTNGAGQIVASKTQNINALTGNLEGGELKSLPSQQSVLVDLSVIVSYGFYDAGRGIAGLPNTDLCWVTVSPNWSNWMGALAPTGSSQSQRPFSAFVLPTAHDVGMNSMQNCDAILNNAGPSIGKVLKAMLGGFGAAGAAILKLVEKSPIENMASEIISSLAITQKDPLPTILAMGARYFEFRPAHISTTIQFASPLPQDKLYFQHSMVTGMSYDQFLHDIVLFLIANPSEIILVQLRRDGVPDSCTPATDTELSTALTTALALSHGLLLAGTLKDIQALSISTLRTTGKRLIIMNNLNQYSSYDKSNFSNSTLNGSNMLSQFKTMSSSEEQGHDIAIFQCQATASNIPDVVVAGIFSSNTQSSCLLCTKATCDYVTLPWLRDNLPGNMDRSKSMVVMNDFFDGATADVAIGLSRKLLGI